MLVKDFMILLNAAVAERPELLERRLSVATINPSVGGRAHSPVKQLTSGIDWNTGMLFIECADELLAVSEGRKNIEDARVERVETGAESSRLELRRVGTIGRKPLKLPLTEGTLVRLIRIPPRPEAP